MTDTQPQMANGWAADKTYYITFNLTNRLVNGLYGAIAPFVDIVHSNDDTESHYIGTMTQELHDHLAESVLNPTQVCFWQENNTPKFRKLMVDFGPNTYLDNKPSAVVGLDNLITLVAKVTDENGVAYTDIPELQIKNLSKLDFPVSINGNPEADYKQTGVNGATQTFKLGKTGRCTVRIKAHIPEVDTLWLSIYPELYGYNDQDLANLAAWAATQ